MTKARRLLLAACAAGLIGSIVGCCGLLNPASRLYGKWKLDIEATIDRNAGGTDIQAGLARAAWGVLGGDVIVEFRSDGTGTFAGNSIVGGGTEEGSWTVVRAESDLIIVQFTSNNSGESRQVDLVMKDPDTFEVAGDNGNVAIFRRVQE